MPVPVARQGTPTAPKPGVVARFDAVVSARPERWSLTVLDRTLAEHSRSSLAAKTTYSQWPPPGFEKLSMAAAPIEQVLLARLKAALDFGTDLAAPTPEALDMAITRTWPGVAADGSYERVIAEAEVYASGEVEWGYSHGGNAAPPLPVESMSGVSPPNGKTALDAYVQNQLRLAVLTEAARSPS